MREDSRSHKFQFPPINVEKGYEVVHLLKEIGQNHGASTAQVAITWILVTQQSNVGSKCALDSD